MNSLFGGLDEIIDYLSNVRFEKSDIDYLRSLIRLSFLDIIMQRVCLTYYIDL